MHTSVAALLDIGRELGATGLPSYCTWAPSAFTSNFKEVSIDLK